MASVYVLVDRSGSMSMKWDDTTESINAFIAGLSEGTYMHVAVFDSESYDLVGECLSEDWDYLAWLKYKPRAMTPLYDSCWKIMKQAELDNDERTTLVIVTDGFENGSVEMSLLDIKQKLAEWKGRGWETVFIGADFEHVNTISTSLGLDQSKAFNISAGQYDAAFRGLTASVTNYALTGASIDVSDILQGK